MDALPHCPTCGQIVDWLDTVSVDLNANNLIYGDGVVHLTPAEAEILYVLRRHAPLVVHNEVMFQAIDPLGHLTDARKQVQVMVCRMRRKMAALPWTIKTVHGVGYWLSLIEPDSRVATTPADSSAPRGDRTLTGSNVAIGAGHV